VGAAISLLATSSAAYLLSLMASKSCTGHAGLRKNAIFAMLFQNLCLATASLNNLTATHDSLTTSLDHTQSQQQEVLPLHMPLLHVWVLHDCPSFTLGMVNMYAFL
jgi:hypothetical protein